MRKPKLTLLLAVIIDFVFQFVAFYYLNLFTYSVCILRFVSALIIGIWISNQDFTLKSSSSFLKLKEIISKNKIIFVLSIIGIIYLLMWYLIYSNHLSIQIPYLNTEFSTFSNQNILSFFYTFLIVIIVLNVFPDISGSKMLNYLGIIGKASYHIFLIQILYFTLFSFTIFSGVIIFGSLITILIDTLICLLLGIGFYYLEKYVYSIEKIKNLRR